MSGRIRLQLPTGFLRSGRMDGPDHRVVLPRGSESEPAGNQELLRTATVGSTMAVRVLGTGVELRLPREDELRALEQARSGGEFELEGERSYTYFGGAGAPAADEINVVAQAFVDFTDGSGVQRWGSFEHHGHTVPIGQDATLELLAVVDEVMGDLVEDLLSDMRIAGLEVSRWQFVSAPRRIELTSDLEVQLAPLRRG